MTHPNNKGLTLVELICTIALFSLIGLAAMSMMTVVAKMNHAVALQEKQAREAEVVIETVKYQLLRHPSIYDETNGYIYVQTTEPEQAKTLTFEVRESDGKYNLYMVVKSADAAEEEIGTESLLAADLAEDGFKIDPPRPATLTDPAVHSYTITLKYANGNEFSWVITPRLRTAVSQ